MIIREICAGDVLKLQLRVSHTPGLYKRTKVRVESVESETAFNFTIEYCNRKGNMYTSQKHLVNRHNFHLIQKVTGKEQAEWLEKLAVAKALVNL